MAAHIKDEEAIFWHALDVASSTERRAYLDAACGEDHQLRRRVEVLLAAHDTDDAFLQTPAVVETEKGQPAESPGTLIGRYQLKELIGEGGFGDVWLAEQQEPVRRQVALKIIKLGMDTKQVVARFEAERQALALMEHPHIAKVLDAGATEAGRPYFVMELVRGTPITEHCDQHMLSIPERLELFMKVCGAVQHAHQKGIIHRDLKPTNILVTLHDGQPVPKVIDFGIAKAIQQRLTEQTVYTAFHQFIGTPEYMSPEQAEHSDQDIDTRSDIYSLGVLLYELLVSTTPFDREQLKIHGYSEICRVISESEPVTPSRRLSRLGDTVNDMARHRRITPVDLGKQLRGDLDWIVMKAMEKDRSRRYETATALSQDIEKHLHDEPVLARPPSTAYRTRKFLRKHRGPVAALSAVFAALIVGLVVSEFQRRLANKARHEANESASLAQAVTQQKEQLLYVADINTAYEAWEDSDLPRVGALLSRQLPSEGETDRRGFEWHYLRNLYDRTLAAPGLKHDQRVWDMVFSADNGTVATVTNGAIYLWDYASHELVQCLQGNGHDLGRLAISPDGKILASGGADEVVKLWDVATGKQLRQPLDFDATVRAMAFSPSGELLAVGGRTSNSGLIQIWDHARGEVVNTLKGHQASVESLAWSEQAGILVSGSHDRTVRVWDTTTFQPRHTFTSHRHRVKTVTISRSGHRVASGGNGRTVMVWDPVRGGEPLRLVRRDQRTNQLAFSPDGQRLAAGYNDGIVAIWDLKTTSIRSLIRGHMGGAHAIGVRGLHYSADGSVLISAGGDSVRLWSIDAADHGTTETGHHDWGSQIAVCGEQNRLAMASGELSTDAATGELILWDLETRKPRPFRSGENPVFRSVAASRDGELLATGDRNGDVRLWDATSGESLKLLGAHLHSVISVAISSDKSKIASGDWGSPKGSTSDSGSWSSTVNVWDRNTGERLHGFPLPLQVAMDLEFSPEGEFLVVAGGRWRSGIVSVLCLASGAERWSLVTRRMVSDVSFSPDGETLAVTDRGGSVTLCRFATGKPIALMQSGNQNFDAGAFSPDGKTFATGSVEGNVILWNVATADKLTQFQVGVGVTSVAFLPDGNLLAAACGDRSLHLWRTDGTNDVLQVPPE